MLKCTKLPFDNALIGECDQLASCSFKLSCSPPGSRSWRAVQATQPGGCSADRDRPVGLRDRRARACGGGNGYGQTGSSSAAGSSPPRDVAYPAGPARLQPDGQPGANGRRAAAHRRFQGRSPARNGSSWPPTPDGSRQPAPRRAARHAPGFASRLPADRPAPAPARRSGPRPQIVRHPRPWPSPPGKWRVGRLPPVHPSQRDHEPSLRRHTYPLFSMLEPSSPAPLGYAPGYLLRAEDDWQFGQAAQDQSVAVAPAQRGGWDG
jgi:hypothetical protein